MTRFVNCMFVPAIRFYEVSTTLDDMLIFSWASLVKSEVVSSVLAWAEMFVSVERQENVDNKRK